MRILVTGGAGFIGSHLCEALVAAGHQVTAIDDLSTGRRENLGGLQGQPNFQFVRETILNAQVLDRLASQAEAIVHLAAAVGVQLIVQDPVRTIHTNIMGCEAVLSAANRYGCKVLLASSSEVYGKSEQLPFREDDDCLLGPTTHSRWAYAASKMVDEFLGLAYFRQFGLPVLVLRFFNIIGPRQTGRYGMVVPRFVEQALRGQALTVYGDGRQTRCFLAVQDAVRGVRLALEHPQAAGQVFNLGGEQEISMRQLAERVIALTGSRSTIQLVPYDQAYAPGFEDMRRRAPDTSRLRALTGWQPQLSLDQALQQVIAAKQAELRMAEEV